MSAYAQRGRGGIEPLGSVFRNTLAVRAVVAGVIGGILIDLFLILTRMAPFPGIYQFVASGLVGKVAYTSSSYIWLGLIMHFTISVVWALLYAYGANAMHVLRRWLVGGFVFGVVVMFAMHGVEMVSHIAQPLSLLSIESGLMAHLLFFGWPVAGYLSLTDRRV